MTPAIKLGRNQLQRSLLQEGLGAERILKDRLGFTQRSDLIGTSFLSVFVTGVTLAASWLQILQILHDGIELRSGVLELSLQSLHLLLERVLLGRLHRRV